MTNNETEFANQDEEISYKDMWLDYKKRLKEVQEEAEQSAMINERLRQERGLARWAKAADMSIVVFAFLWFASMVATVALLAGGVI